MCGRFTLRTPTPVLIKEFDLATGPELQPRYNVAPTQDVAVVRHDPRQQRELSLLRWGLVPFWAKDISIGNRLINARSETAAEKPAFRAAFQRRRCLVLADGYYEWTPAGKQKQPYWIRMTGDRPFAMAGLWERWTGPDDQQPPLESCTILTTDSNELTSDLHDRMPVILDSKHWEMWLDAEFHARQFLEPLLAPYPSDAMQVDPVSTFVNNARHEGVECIAIQRELF
jgi:putative SOS response-associated peptidase YedK